MIKLSFYVNQKIDEVKLLLFVNEEKYKKL